MDETRDQKAPPLFTSIALHILLFGAIFYLLSREPLEGTKSDPIQIDTFQEKKAARVRPPRTSTGVAHHDSKATQTSHSVSLSDLGMRFSTDPLPEPAETAQSTPSPDVPNNDGWDVMNPDPKIARFNQYIYNTVQGWLDRDAYMNTEKMYGTVKVKIWFDENGNYLENETVYDAIDPNFKRIVQRALSKSFAVPIPRPFLYVHKKFSIERMVVVR